MQYVQGLQEFQTEPPFDLSMIVRFCKRFPVEQIAKINEYICTGVWPEEMCSVDRNEQNDSDNAPKPSGVKSVKDKKKPNTTKKKQRRQKKDKKNGGKLILDATVAPADIKYPTDGFDCQE